MKNPISTLSLIAFLFISMIGVSFAVEQHAPEARKHAQLAAQHGKMGHADVLVKHDEEALEHVNASIKVHLEAGAHLNKAKTHLEEAIKHGKMGHADVAAKHTKEAIKHIDAANDLMEH